MRISTSWISLISGILVTCIPAGAQQYVAVQYVDQARTPIEHKLESAELAMPGLGLGSSRVQLSKRFDYAQQNKWLTAEQLEQLRKELKVINDKEAGLRDTAGKLSFEARQDLGKQINDLNAKFEEQVLIREQSMPGVEGLRARQAMLQQRISKAIALGKINAKKASAIKVELRAAASGITEDISEAQTREVAKALGLVSQKLDKEMETAGQVAGRGTFSIRPYDHTNSTY